MIWRRFILCGLFLAALSGRAAGEDVGQAWFFRVGDDPGWAVPDLDASDWTRAENPPPLALRRYPHRGWYRLHFTLPAERPEGGWGVALGRIQTADEVFLNGVFIGGEGVIADRFVDALYKKRMYALPDEWLRSEGNVLAIRVQSSFERGGLTEASAVFDDYLRLRDATDTREMRRQLLEAFFFGLLALALAFWLLMLLFRVRQPEYVHVGALVAILTGISVLESLLWHRAGLATPFTQRVVLALFFLMPAPLFLFSAHMENAGRILRLYKALIVFSAAMGLGWLWKGDLRWVRPAEWVWWGVLAALGLLLVRQALQRRVWKESAEPLTVAGGLALFAVLLLIEQLLPTRMATALPFGSFLHAGFLSLVGALACAIAIRVRRAHEYLRALSRQLLAAQEEAARRTATVLHNDLAPTLATVKLELQMFLMKHPHADGRRMVETLSHAIDRARDLSREIHPAVVDHLGLPAALRALSGRLAEANGWVLTLDTPESMNLPGRTAALLYRIGQELLYNVTKHAGARRVDMILADGRRGLHLVVRDDGKGCNPATVRPGIGWISLRERVSALGGRCRMTPRKNRGLEVSVWIPHP